MPKISTQAWFPSTLLVDGVEIDVRVKRMNNREYDAYVKEFARLTGETRGAAEPSHGVHDEEWARQALDTFLEIVPGQIDDDGRDVTKGGELLDIYGGRMDVLSQAFTLINIENQLSPAQKKISKSALASVVGSMTAPQPMGTGDAPGSTAMPADASGSVPAEAVTVVDEPVLSGTTAP